MKRRSYRRVVVGRVRSRYIPGPPTPIVVLAIDDDIGDIPGSDARPIEQIASLRLTGRGEEHGYVVESPIRDCGGESECCITRHKQVIARVVLQFESIARPRH